MIVLSGGTWAAQRESRAKIHERREVTFIVRSGEEQ